MVGNNACGSHSVAWGKTVDNTVRLEMLTYRGERIDTAAPDAAVAGKLSALVDRVGHRVRESFPDLTRRVSGYNLDQLLPERNDLAKALVGAEGTLGTTVAATMALVASPPVRALAVLGFPDAYVAADNVMVAREHGPLTIEGMDAGLIAALRVHNPVETMSRALPPGGGWLYVETGGATRAEAEDAARAVAAAMRPHGLTEALVESDPARMKALWRIREDGAGIVTRGLDGGEAWPGWEDAAVPPERFGAYLRAFDQRPRPARPQGHLLRPLRRRLPARPDRLRPLDPAGHRELPGVHGGRGRHRRRARRVALGRARRRARALRAAPAHVPAGDHRRVRGVQGRLRPGRPDEPGNIVRSARMDADLRMFVGMPTMPDEPQLALHPTTAARSPGPPAAASASASA